MLTNSYTAQSFCNYPFQRLKFTCEGDVTMCCFHERKCLGNILNKSLEQIWLSPLAEEIRNQTLQGTLHSTCKQEYCPFFHQKKLIKHKVEMKMFPVEFEIDLPSQHCNIGGEKPNESNPACIMCERHRQSHKEFWQNDRLNEVCVKLKPYVRHLQWLHIQGIAEPFWKDRIFEMLELLNVEPYKKEMWVSTTTNGTLMTEERRKRFLQYPKSTITWSLDAGTPEVYQKIRRVKMYDKIVENLKAYSREKSNTRCIHIHNNINTINIGDVEKMVELAAEVKAERLDFNATYGVPEICVNQNNFRLFEDAQVRIIALSKKLGVNTTFMRNLSLDFATPKLIQIEVRKS